MTTIQTSKFKILLAEHTGMCFGVKKAIAATERLLSKEPTTILGQLAHNPAVQDRLAKLGARDGKLEGKTAATKSVVITAHGAADQDRRRWKDAGYQIVDTTCPLVHVAHRKLGKLVSDGYFPVIIGKLGHVEVRGLMGDFPGACVILSSEDIALIPEVARLGIISQTTQPIDKVRALVEKVRLARPHADIKFQDTVCQPTKDRQRSLIELCQASELVIAIGGRNSNNTAQLKRTALSYGCSAYHVTNSDELDASWFARVKTVGVTAGTSTMSESMDAVIERLKEFSLRLV